MAQAATLSHHRTRTTSLKTKAIMADSENRNDAGSDDEEGGGKSGSRSKSRRELPAGAVATLKAWLLSPEHFTHPYPTPQDQVMLMQKTGIDKKQLKNWFTNARRRIWKPMLKKQLEQGKLTATGAGGGGVAVPGVVPGLMIPAVPGGIVGQPDQVQYQQPVPHPHAQQTAQVQQEVQVDQYGNNVYSHQSQAVAHAAAPGQVASSHPPQQQTQQPQYYDPATPAPGVMPVSSSIGSLPPINQTAPGQPMSKTDSHAVLMELFARDQDLVRQATESAGLKSKVSIADAQGQAPTQGLGSMTPGQVQPPPSQHPMRTPSQARLVNVPTLNSWPHFSSVSSLNNLGTMPGVKSITSLSGADLAKQGPVNTMENLAQVKSVESMGKNDSYAFLEVFFGDKSSQALSSMAPKDQRGVKRDEDNDVGLSLEDESPSTAGPKKEAALGPVETPAPADAGASAFTSKTSNDSTGTLKRAYDDALAARGLISVSRSCEKLTDLALPAKIQRTLSQEYLRQQRTPAPQSQETTQPYGQYPYPSQSAAPAQSDAASAASTAGQPQTSSGTQQYPGQHPGQQQLQQSGQAEQRNSFVTGPKDSNASVEVPSATKCAICHQTGVDTQLRPCGHMFHERCLKPTLQATMGPPKCPIDNIPMQSALLAIPTDENAKSRPIGAPMQPQPASWSAAPVGPGQIVSSDTQR